MFLVTKWFGCFLIDDDNKVVEQILFPGDPIELAKRLKKIYRQEVLEEERKLAEDKQVIVFERRLSSIGLFKPEATEFNIDGEDLGYSSTLLREATLLLTREMIDEQLSSRDFQVIQMIDALDDLFQIMNLLSERINCWSILPGSSEQLISLKDLRERVNDEIHKLQKEITRVVEDIAPNTSKLVGPTITARLVSLAGGLSKLAMLPASTIQLLGAEKAFFRYKKEGGSPPKHGVLFQHPIINKASPSIRGKLTRILANEITVAVKADVFTKKDISDKLLSRLEEKISSVEKSGKVK